MPSARSSLHPTTRHTPVVLAASCARTIPARELRSAIAMASMPRVAACANSSSHEDAPRRKLKWEVGPWAAVIQFVATPMRQGSVPPRWPTEASSSVNRSGDGDRMRHFALALDAVENAEHRAAAAPSSTPWQSPAISCSASRARPVRVGVSRPLPARRAARSHAAAMAFDLFDLRAPSVDGGLRPHDIDRSPCMGLAIMFAICSKRGGRRVKLGSVAPGED